MDGCTYRLSRCTSSNENPVRASNKVIFFFISRWDFLRVNTYTHTHRHTRDGCR